MKSILPCFSREPLKLELHTWTSRGILQALLATTRTQKAWITPNALTQIWGHLYTLAFPIVKNKRTSKISFEITIQRLRKLMLKNELK